MASYNVRQREPLLDARLRATLERRGLELLGLVLMGLAVLCAVMLATHSPEDPGWMAATDAPINNALGRVGATLSGPLLIIAGLASWGLVAAFGGWGLRLVLHRGDERFLNRIILVPIAIAITSTWAATLIPASGWPQVFGLGGVFGDTLLGAIVSAMPMPPGPAVNLLALVLGAMTLGAWAFVLGFTRSEVRAVARFLLLGLAMLSAALVTLVRGSARGGRAAGAATLRRASDGAATLSRMRSATVRATAQPPLTGQPAAAGRTNPVAFSTPAEPAEPQPARSAPRIIRPAPPVSMPHSNEVTDDTRPVWQEPAPGIATGHVQDACAPEEYTADPHVNPDAATETTPGVLSRLRQICTLPGLDPASQTSAPPPQEMPGNELIEPPLSRAAMDAQPMGEDRVRARISDAIRARSRKAPALRIARTEPPVRRGTRAPSVMPAKPVAPPPGAGRASPWQQSVGIPDTAGQNAPLSPADARAQLPRAVITPDPAPAPVAAPPPPPSPPLSQAPGADAGFTLTGWISAALPFGGATAVPEHLPPEVPGTAPSVGTDHAAQMAPRPDMPPENRPASLAWREEPALESRSPQPLTAEPLFDPVDGSDTGFGGDPHLADTGALRPTATVQPGHVLQRRVVQTAGAQVAQSRRARAEAQPGLQFDTRMVEFELPPLSLLTDPDCVQRYSLSEDALEENARMLETVLDDYGVRGEIVSVRPGPVVTMYELEPAPGLKASRVIGLADDIARSMSALSARVSTVPGRSVIGIELPNAHREKVVLREILAAREFGDSSMSLPLALGKDIGGAPVVANLAKMPHLLIAGTTGSGKSVAINTMILSLLYTRRPEECRLIMIDPKMLELSVYDDIPHLLSPVVTDPKKAVTALKWVVAEMEDRYRKMSKMGVRNIEGYNGRVREALDKGEMFKRTVQTGFDDETGDPVFETEEFAPELLPFIVVVVDEMADLMMVAGKEIEACIQRLAQMARASGIHLIMATQRPSVDVITGTIKANFPTRISFQVTSKIDSRTILGEMGAEQLLGMGDMLYMAGGSRITRVHGPFVSDEEVEEIVTHLKSFGPPTYMSGVVEGPDSDKEADIDAVLGLGGNTTGEDALYDQAVAVVIQDRKCSTSYIQRKLGIGYNKAARLVEQMEDQGVVTPANHVGKREVLVPEQG